MSRTSLAVVLALFTSCTAQVSGEVPAKGEDPAKAPVDAKAMPGPAPIPAAPAIAESAPSPPAGVAPHAGPPPKPAPPLTDDERALIAADPKDLTIDERRKRGYALRKKIMQNPDSPAARALEDLRRAAERGEIDPPDLAKNKAKSEAGMWLEVDPKGGVRQKGGAPPTGARK